MLILALATPVFQVRLISAVIRAVDLARRDLTAREQRADQHAGRLGAGRYALGLDARPLSSQGGRNSRRRGNAAHLVNNADFTGNTARAGRDSVDRTRHPSLTA